MNFPSPRRIFWLTRLEMVPQVPNEPCPICLEPFTTETQTRGVRIIACKHAFHSNCLRKLRPTFSNLSEEDDPHETESEVYTCPMCRGYMYQPRHALRDNFQRFLVSFVRDIEREDIDPSDELFYQNNGFRLRAIGMLLANHIEYTQEDKDEWIRQLDMTIWMYRGPIQARQLGSIDPLIIIPIFRTLRNILENLPDKPA